MTRPILTPDERRRILDALQQTEPLLPQCPACGEPVEVPQWGAHRARCAPHYCPHHGGWGPSGPDHCAGCWAYNTNWDAGVRP